MVDQINAVDLRWKRCTSFDPRLLQVLQYHEARELLEKIDNVCGLADIRNRTLLHYSADYGNVAMVRYFIEKGCYLDSRDFSGDTPLMIAVKNKDVAITEALLKYNVNLFDVNARGYSTLQFAFEDWMRPSDRFSKDAQSLIVGMMFKKVNKDFMTNKSAIAKFFLNAKSLVKLSAVALANLELVTILLENDYPIDFCDYKTKLTALHCAIILGKFDNAKLLIERGANVDVVDNAKRSPLFYYFDDFELVDKNSEVLKMFLRHSTHLNLRNHGDMSLIDRLLSYGKNETVMTVLQSYIDMKNLTMVPLYTLMPNRNVNIIEIIKFIDSTGMKFDLNAYGPKNETILMIAASWCREGLEIVALLIKYGADVNFTSPYQLSALQMAAENCFILEDQEMIELLLMNGADAQQVFSNGMTLIDFVNSIGHRRKRCSTKPIVAHVAMLAAMDESSVSEIMRNSIDADSIAKNHFGLCMQQLEKLKNTVVYGTVTMFKLLRENDEKILAYARNPELIKAFNQTIKKMPRFDSYYFNTLRKKIAKAVERTKLEEKVIPVIKTLTGYCVDVHPTIVYQIVHYLNTEDIEILCQV